MVGGIGALIGETWKFWWIDDDFMIQMIPAILLAIVWFIISHVGLPTPNIIIHPFA